MEETVTKKASHVYNVENMVVTAFGGNQFAYWRYDVSAVPEEVRLFCLKGFIDDLQDCTTGIKKGDYPKTPAGDDAYRMECLSKRRDLERHINEGTRPVRSNAADPATTDLRNKVKELKSSFDFRQLDAMRILGLHMSPEQKAKLDEFDKIVE